MPRKPKYPCGICSKAVTWKSSGVQCEGKCENLFHVECMGLTHSEYTAFGNSSIVWICNHCGAHNISKTNLGISSLSSTHFTQNTFDVRDNSNDIQHKHSSSSDPRSPGSPVLSSSPLHSRPRKANSKPHPRVLKILKEKVHNSFNLISEERVNKFKQNSENLKKISWKIRKLWHFEVLQIFKKHFLTSRYEYANEWVDDVIASQFSIHFVHRNDKNFIF